MKRAVLSVVRTVAPLYGAIDGFVSSWIGRRELLLFVAHFDPPESTPDSLRTIERSIERIRDTCRLLPLGEALERLARGDLPPRPAVLFVDDATRSFHETGYRVLVRLQVPFVLAVIAGLVPADDHEHALASVMRVANQGRETSPAVMTAAWRRVIGAGEDVESYASFFRRARELDVARLSALRETLDIPEDPLMTWDELAAARAESRVEFANHTMSHPLMKHATGEWLEFEVATARRRLEQRLGLAVADFVFPYGTEDNTTPAAVEAVRRAGHRAAYLVRMGVARRHAFLMPRAPLEARPPLDRLTTSHALNTLASVVRP